MAPHRLRGLSYNLNRVIPLCNTDSDQGVFAALYSMSHLPFMYTSSDGLSAGNVHSFDWAFAIQWLDNELVQTTPRELKSHVVLLHSQKKTDFDIYPDQPKHHGMSPGHERNLINIL